MTYRIYLGGSFDPVHHAHLQMAITAFEQLSALHLPVTVTLLPTAGNPFKGAPTPTAHRLAMLTLATAHLPISIDEREIHEPPPVYTIDTVRQLRDKFADDVLIYLIGQDSLSSLPRWKSGEQLPDLVKFWAFTRVGETESIDASVSARLTDDLTRFLSDDGLIYQDPSHSIYQKITVKDNRILSGVLYGDVQEGGWFFELIQNQQDISAIKDKLLFGKAFCEELLAG